MTDPGKVVELVEDRKWIDDLILTEQRNPRPILANVIAALRIAPDWRGVLTFNEFAFRTEAIAAPPWSAGVNDWTTRPWTDADDVLAADWCQHQGIHVSTRTVAEAVEAVAQDRRYHPVRDYLDGLTWDGMPRIDTLATAYLGAEDTDYTRAVGSRFLIAAVARIYRPGCKADCMAILEGPQGALKSTALRIIGQPWFTDEIAEMGSKDAALQLAGMWLVETAELESMTRADVTKVKEFLSRTTDRFRPPYGRRLIERPRQCVLVGSTNADTYLKDETGGRRFWPIKCGRIHTDALARDRDQLWAEAVLSFDADEPWWLDDANLVKAASDEQAGRYATDPWTDTVLTYAAAHAPDISVEEALRNAINLKVEQWGQREENRVARILKFAGWQRFQQRDGQRRVWRYRRPDDWE